MQNTKELPYFRIKQKPEEKTLANFLLRKFKSGIKQQFPWHYLAQPIPHKTLSFIKKYSRKYPYFIRFDIRLYYPSIRHAIILKKLPEIYLKIFKKPLSRRFKRHIKHGIPKILAQSPYGNGLSIGSRLSWVLAGIFLLDLDLEMPLPFLRQTDDYLVFCNNKKESGNLLKKIILPKLQELNLEINEKKIKSGKFYQDKVDFIGFEFYTGYFMIKQEKIEEFRKKIKKLTYLTKNKPKEAIIKSLNNKILGFGHYYKFASAKKEFEELDGFIRMRLRRYIFRNKNNEDREANIILTNKTLKEMGLKSLTEIKEKYTLKKRHNIKKIAENRSHTGQFRILKNWPELEKISEKYSQKMIFKQLSELTKSLKKIERRITEIERKVVI